MRIMTSNIWGDYFGNPVSVREEGLYEVFAKYSPDILGFQEVTRGWYNGKMFSKLAAEYDFVGTEIFGSTNYVPFAYKREAGFVLRAKGYEMLENTPDISKAITWAYFERKEADKKSFAVCNTHFWWKTGKEHDLIRERNAKQLSALMKNLAEKYSCPVFAFGDMNCTVESSVFDIYSANGFFKLHSRALEKSDKSSHHGDPKLGGDGKYHGKTTENDFKHSIDHIIGYGENIRVACYEIVEEQNALDSTDHSPVYADIDID